MSRGNALAGRVVAAFLASRGWNMTARCALEMALAKVVAPSREQLHKGETGQAKRVGKRGAFSPVIKPQKGTKRTAISGCDQVLQGL